jgi:hypothetical protein
MKESQALRESHMRGISHVLDAAKCNLRFRPARIELSKLAGNQEHGKGFN